MKNKRGWKILSGFLSVLLTMHGFSAINPDALTYRRMEHALYMAAEDAFSISGGTVMTDIAEGTPVIIQGIVTSAESLITELRVGIYAQTGEPVLEQIILPNALTFDIYQLDSSMSFNLLEIGSYTYRVIVSNAEYTDYILVDQNFAVVPSDAPEDALTLTGGTVIGDIAAGTGVEVRGTVYSAETPITLLAVGIYDVSGTLVSGTAVQPNDWYYNLNALDAEIRFDLLTAGEYYYNVTASNASYQDFVLVNQSFSVLSDVPAATETTSSSVLETTAVSSTDQPETTFVTTAVTVTETTSAVTESSAEILETTSSASAETTSETTTQTTESAPLAESGTETTDYQYKSITAKGVSVIPTLTEGSSFSLQGIMSCSKADMDALTALIYNADGETVLYENAYPASASYDLKNLSLPFETLSAGSYSFKVFVSVQASGALPVIYQKFDVIAGGTPVIPEDTLTLTGGTAVRDIVKGTPVLVSGVITSAVSGITGAAVGIYDMDGNLISGMSAEPNTKSYDLSALDSGIRFDLLDAGIYEYRVTAGNAALTDEVLMSRSFSVLESAEPAEPDALTITGNAPILNMLNDAQSSITGTVQSAESAITELTVGIYYMSGELVCEQRVQPNERTYELNQLDSSALFGSLLPSVYEYRITANNAAYQDKILVNQKFTVSAICR